MLTARNECALSRAFHAGEVSLSDLKKLDKLNGFTYDDLPPSRKRRFGYNTVRMIEMREGVDEESRRDIFSRINTGNLRLNPVEVRWGTQDGPFLRFIRQCCKIRMLQKTGPSPAKRRLNCGNPKSLSPFLRLS